MLVYVAEIHALRLSYKKLRWIKDVRFNYFKLDLDTVHCILFSPHIQTVLHNAIITSRMCECSLQLTIIYCRFHFNIISVSKLSHRHTLTLRLIPNTPTSVCHASSGRSWHWSSNVIISYLCFLILFKITMTLVLCMENITKFVYLKSSCLNVFCIWFYNLRNDGDGDFNLPGTPLRFLICYNNGLWFCNLRQVRRPSM